ncbi:hypothetical protein [Croceicoccus bisphenolivorans]|uniref:hypothetical protein n=1 Tax=Croceicoccus bisphenolivorans TaxID=1783232 RepID=UPI0012E7E874|nr:hypothetical protein [Croceicoccus bisphenolivorans]
MSRAHFSRIYAAEVSHAKRGSKSKTLRLVKIQKDAVSRLGLAVLTACHIAEYRDRRLQRVRPATVHPEIALMAHALNVAHREWSIFGRCPSDPAQHRKIIRSPSWRSGEQKDFNHHGEADALGW